MQNNSISGELQGLPYGVSVQKHLVPCRSPDTLQDRLHANSEIWSDELNSTLKEERKKAMNIPKKKIPHLSIKAQNLTAHLRLRLDVVQMYGKRGEENE